MDFVSETILNFFWFFFEYFLNFGVQKFKSLKSHFSDLNFFQQKIQIVKTWFGRFWISREVKFKSQIRVWIFPHTHLPEIQITVENTDTARIRTYKISLRANCPLHSMEFNECAHRGGWSIKNQKFHYSKVRCKASHTICGCADVVLVALIPNGSQIYTNNMCVCFRKRVYFSCEWYGLDSGRGWLLIVQGLLRAGLV